MLNFHKIRDKIHILLVAGGVILKWLDKISVKSMIILPILILSLMGILINVIYINYYVMQLKKQYELNSISISENINDDMNEVLKNTNMLFLNQEIKKFIFDTKAFTSGDIYEQQKISDYISLFRASKDIIHDVFIVDATNTKILRGEGLSTTAYNKELEGIILQNDSSMHYKILSPVLVEHNKVIPIFINWIDSVKIVNPLLVFLNVNELDQMVEEYKQTPNSTIFLYDINNQNIIAGDEISKSYQSILDTLFKEESNKDSSSKRYINNEKNLLLYSVSSSLLYNHYAYIESVPYTDILSINKGIILLSFAFLIIVFVISIFFSLFLIKKIYSPIKKSAGLIASLKNNVWNPVLYKNELDYINRNIINVYDEQNKLKSKVTEAENILLDQYYNKVLLNNDKYLESDFLSLLNTYHIKFEKNYYIVSIIQLYFTSKYYTVFDTDQQENIYRSIYSIIASYEIEYLNTRCITLDENKFCIIGNLSEEIDAVKLQEIYEKLLSYFLFDSDLLYVYCGLGNLHTGIQGLKKSYEEAYKALLAIPRVTKNRFYMYNSTNEFGEQYYLSQEEESNLYHLLLNSNTEQVFILLSNIIDKNIDIGVSEAEIKKLYLKLYDIGKRILDKKQVDEQQLMQIDYQNMEEKYLICNSADLSKYIFKFFLSISDYFFEPSSEESLGHIVEYLSEHLDQELYMEQISEMFHVPESKIIKYIKKQYNTTFYKFISSLRIQKSIDYLINSDYTIDDIATKCGYNSRHTYIRMFKNSENMTPTQYRFHYKNEK